MRQVMLRFSKSLKELLATKVDQVKEQRQIRALEQADLGAELIEAVKDSLGRSYVLGEGGETKNGFTGGGGGVGGSVRLERSFADTTERRR